MIYSKWGGSLWREKLLFAQAEILAFSVGTNGVELALRDKNTVVFTSIKHRLPLNGNSCSCCLSFISSLQMG